MVGKLKFVLISSVLVIFTNGAPRTYKFPPGFKKCPQISKEFNKCALQAAAEVLPNFLKGNKNLGVPSLAPLKLPLIRLEASRNLNLNMTDVPILGLEGTKVTLLTGDFENRRISLGVHVDQLTIEGTYVIDGNILFLPIVGTGPGELKVFGGDYEFTFYYDFFEKNGFKHGNMTKNEFKFDVKKAEFKLEGLFNGDKQLGDEMNKFLNENWKAVLDDFGKLITDTVSSLITQLTVNLLQKIPFDDFFSE